MSPQRDAASFLYGANSRMPFSEHDGADHPLQFYAATKRANELMAHAYSQLFRLPTTGLRFFTVYGPWGRPDMAPIIFTRAIDEQTPINVYYHCKHSRDFTYIDAIVEGVIRASDQIAEAAPDWDPSKPDPATSNAPFRIFNIGNSGPIELAAFIAEIEAALGKTAIKTMMPLQPRDAVATYANVTELAKAVGYSPTTSVQEGVAKLVEWCRSYKAATEHPRDQCRA